MRALRYAQLTGLALAALAAHATVVQPRRLLVRDVPLAVPGWPAELDGLRVAVVGDLHAGAPAVGLRRLGQVVQQVVDARPDLVVLLGDHLADVWLGTHLQPEQVAEVLAGLREAAPVVGVLGNHDWYAGGHRVRRALTAAGLPVLEESAVPVLDGRLWVAGVSDLWERTPSVERALAGVPAGAPVVLLTHNPDVVLDVPPHVQLVLAGHTHGGQVRVLGRGVHTVSERTGNRFSAGWFAQERLYVTPGVGASIAPVRTVLPEVPVLVLSPA
ncbi:MAG: metallophosphoesterase [Frankiaceae bacterium]|nr:metallophosphoesterase [Frankiaceae bacterium]